MENVNFSHWADPATAYPAANSSPYVSSIEATLFVVDVILLVTTLVGNVVTIYVVCGQKRVKSTHNITIVSIAVADIFVATFVMPLYLMTPRVDIVGDQKTPFMCKLSQYVWHWCKTVSAYSILAMVIDKHAKRQRASKRRLMSGRCLFFLNFVWFFGAAYNIWQVVLSTSANLSLTSDDVLHGARANMTLRRCVVLHTFPILLRSFAVADFFVIFIFPGAAILKLYVNMANAAWRSRPAGGGATITGNGSSQKTRRLLLSVLLAAIFGACHLPVEILKSYTLHQIEAPPATQLTLTELFETLAFAQGFFNVIAYASCSKEAYSCTRKIFICHEHGQTTTTTTTTAIPLILQPTVDEPTISETIT